MSRTRRQPSMHQPKSPTPPSQRTTPRGCSLESIITSSAGTPERDRRYRLSWRDRRGYPHVANKPDFVDLHKHKVYIPLPILIPDEQASYIRRMSKEHDQDGLDYILREEPDRLFNWLSVQLRVRLLLTTLTFLILHIGTIVCFSLAVGYAYGPLEATLFFLEGP